MWKVTAGYGLASNWLRKWSECLLFLNNHSIVTQSQLAQREITLDSTEKRTKSRLLRHTPLKTALHG